MIHRLVSLHATGKKKIEQEKQRFDDVFLVMTSFCAKKSEKSTLLGDVKYSLIMFFNDI